MPTRNEERMQHALEDIERYAGQLQEAAGTMNLLVQTLMDTPGTDQAVMASEGFAQLYDKIAAELLHQTKRGLGK